MAGRRKALIVANDQYENEGLRRLFSPAADADALGRVLADPQVGGFDVQVVRNEAAHVISSHVEDLFSDSRPDDVLLLHFSCHGLKSESGELFFAASSTRPNRLGSTAVSADFVQRCMRASRSRSIVLLLDCCYGGAFGQGVAVRASGDVDVLRSFPGGRLGGGRGRAVITASSSMEYAFEGDRLADDQGPAPSVFTSALVEGLASGDADRDEDGWVSLNELYDYVFDRVRERNSHQTPSRDVEMQGELYLARSGRRRVRPQSIPADLRAAMADENMFSRLGAVTELRSRLASENLPVAAGAREALAQIADTDIQYVAEAAAAALREVHTRTAETDLRFGAVAVGADAGTRRIGLLGPPLARVCSVQTSHGWIRTSETPDGYLVSVDAREPGIHRGTVTVRGQLNEVVVPVEVQVTPAESPATDLAPPPAEQASPMPVAPVPPEVVAGGEPGAEPDRRPSADGAGAVELLIVGMVTLFLGVVIAAMRDEDARIWLITAQLLVYAAHWLFVGYAPGEATGMRRVLCTVLGGSVLAAIALIIARPPVYLAYWDVRESPLYLFWVFAGVLQIGAAVAGGARPARALEVTAGVLATLFGLIVIYLVAGQAETILAVSFGWIGIGLGITWVIAGLRRRRAPAT